MIKERKKEQRCLAVNGIFVKKSRQGIYLALGSTA